MRIGLHIESALPSDAARQISAIEARGFAHAWLNQNPGHWEPLTAIAAAGKTNVEVGTAVVPTYPLHPVALASQALSTQEATGGRLTLGIGPSHRWYVTDWLGIDYAAPAAHTREYLEVLLPLLRGEPAKVRGRHFNVDTTLAINTRPPEVLLSALGPRMLRIAGELTDGTILVWVRAKTIADYVVPHITATGATPRIVVLATVVVTDDPDGIRAAVATDFAPVRDMPAYRAVLDRGGLDGPADTVIAGDERTVRRELESLASAGATDLIVSLRGTPAERERTVDALST